MTKAAVEVTVRKPDTTQELLKHVPALDGIRGLAIAAVMVFHMLSWNVNTPSPMLNLLMRVVGSGWVGVDLFFVLSGFLITGILYDALGTANYFKNFYMRRVLRIFPLYYAVLALTLLYGVLTHQMQPVDWRMFGLIAIFLQNTPLYLDAGRTSFAHAFTYHFWSLAVEEQFYLVWPLLVYFVRDRQRLMGLAGALALLAPLLRALLVLREAPLEYLYTFTFCRMDGLLAGAWLALAVRGPARERVLRMARYTLPAALLLLGLIAWQTGNFIAGQNRVIGLAGYSVLAVAAASLIALGLKRGSPTSSALSLPPLRFFGRYSFGLYLFSGLENLAPSIVERIAPWALHAGNKALPHLAGFVTALIMVITTAVVSFHVYERPFLKLKSWFNYRRASA